MFWKSLVSRPGRRPFRSPRADLEDTLVGDYDLRGDRIAGRARMKSIVAMKAAEIQVQRRGRTIATCAATIEHGGQRCTFTMPIEGRFTPAELVDESVLVTACNDRGMSGTLKLDGATQLELIHECLGPPAERILDLDFTRGGNSRPYLGAGWSGAEKDFTWTEGDESVLHFDAPTEPGTYALRITSGAFLHRPDISRQDMDVLVNDTLVGTMAITEPITQFQEFTIASSLFAGPPRTMVRLRHPKAARPCDYSENKDVRRLAFCFKRVSLVRLLADDA